MKKILTVATAMVIMSTGAMAEWQEGKVGAIMQFPSFTKIVLVKTDGTTINNKVSGDAEVQKRIMAMVLMAKSLNLTVKLADAPGEKWNGLIIP